MTASNNRGMSVCGSEIDKETVAFHSNATENLYSQKLYLMCHQAMTKEKEKQNHKENHDTKRN